MDSTLKRSLELLNHLKKYKPKDIVPPVLGSKPKTEMVLHSSFVQNTRGYIERIIEQINGCYENGWYDACSVLIRKTIETLIIECFENKKLSNNIKDSNGDFFPLSGLITSIIDETAWTISRNSKKALKKLKILGDLSAHNRRFIAHRTDIDNIVFDFRVTVQELLSISELK